MLTLALLFYLFIAIVISLVLVIIYFVIKKIIKIINKKNINDNDESAYEDESIIDYNKINEKSEEDVINDINENDSIKTKIKNKIRFLPIKYYFLIVIIIFTFGYIIDLKNNRIDNNIVFPKYPTGESLFIQLKDENILKIGGRLTKPARLKIGANTFITTRFAEIYNVKENNFEPIENSHFTLYKCFLYADGLVLQDGRALFISSEANQMDIYDPKSKTFTLSKNVFFHHPGGSVRLIEMNNGNVFIVSGKEYIVYNPKTDEIIIHEFNNFLENNVDYLLNVINLSNGHVLITFNNGACIYNPYDNSIREVSISNFSKRFYADTIPLGIPVKLHDNRILFFSALQGQDSVLFFNENTEKFELIGKLTKARPLSTPIVLKNNNVYIIGSHFMSNESTFISGIKEDIELILTFKDYVPPRSRVSCEIYNTTTNTSKLTNIRPHLKLSDENMQVFLYNNEVIITPSKAAYRNKQGKYNYGSHLMEHINIKRINK